MLEKSTSDERDISSQKEPKEHPRFLQHKGPWRVMHWTIYTLEHAVPLSHIPFLLPCLSQYIIIESARKLLFWFHMAGVVVTDKSRGTSEGLGSR